jgi:prepilin-type N-terminal cleavage/methylation domain-containing protein
MFRKKIKNKDRRSSGFTLVELMVSVSIFAFMTAFLLAKYGTFNRSVFLTNLAYEVALSIRSAQSYGLNVKGVQPVVGDLDFKTGYGVHFEKTTTSSGQQFILFADILGIGLDGYYVGGNGDSGDYDVDTFTLNRGNKVSDILVGNDCGQPSSLSSVDVADIFFKRPNPNAIISYNEFGSITQASCVHIVLSAPDGNTVTVEVRETGQIAVLSNQ